MKQIVGGDPRIFSLHFRFAALVLGTLRWVLVKHE